HSINLYKWIQQKSSYKELLIVEEKILLEEKLEDVETLSVEDSMKIDYFLLNKKRNIDNFDGSRDNLEEVEKKAVLLYAKYGYLDYEVEDTKEIISLFNKKEKFFKARTD
ncbi:27411_t:CDS:2, partial [Gigaspora margarita]